MIFERWDKMAQAWTSHMKPSDLSKDSVANRFSHLEAVSSRISRIQTAVTSYKWDFQLAVESQVTYSVDPHTGKLFKIGSLDLRHEAA
jgi:hypothetical protein